MPNSEQLLSQSAVPMLPLDVRIRHRQGTTYVGNYKHTVELSDTGGFIWRQIDGVRTVEALGRLVSEEYDVSLEEAVADVVDFLTELVSYGVLRFGGDTA
jgi:Coenzyme PQQ synthesis protein D (PqqD)